MSEKGQSNPLIELGKLQQKKSFLSLVFFLSYALLSLFRSPSLPLEGFPAVAKQQGNSFSLVLPAGPGGWQGEGGTVDALWRLPASSRVHAYSWVGWRSSPPTPTSLVIAPPGRHLGVTAELMIARHPGPQQ